MPMKPSQPVFPVAANPCHSLRFGVNDFCHLDVIVNAHRDGLLLPRVGTMSIKRNREPHSRVAMGGSTRTTKMTTWHIWRFALDLWPMCCVVGHPKKKEKKILLCPKNSPLHLGKKCVQVRCNISLANCYDFFGWREGSHFTMLALGSCFFFFPF